MEEGGLWWACLRALLVLQPIPGKGGLPVELRQVDRGQAAEARVRVLWQLCRGWRGGYCSLARWLGSAGGGE